MVGAVQERMAPKKTDQISQAMMENTPEARKTQVEKIVLAGERFMFDPETHELALSQLNAINGATPAERLAKGIVGLLGQLRAAAKGPWPIPATIPAGVMLLMTAADFLSQSANIEMTPEFLGDAVEKFTELQMRSIGVDSPEKLAEVANQKQGSLVGGGQEGGQGAPQPTAPPEQPAGTGPIAKRMNGVE